MPGDGGSRCSRHPRLPSHLMAVPVIRPKSARQPEAPAAPPEPQMVRIMQTDGTMKMEARYGGQDMVNSADFARNRKNQLASKQEPLIYAADEDKSGKAKK